MSKKICFVVTVSLAAKNFLEWSFEPMHNAGYDISLICDMDEEYMKSLPDYVHKYPIKMARGVDIKGSINAIKEMKKIFLREKFDIVTCRAVTSIPIIIELATSTIKVGGLLAPLKSNCLDELNNKSLYKEFNLKLIDVYKYNLPIQNSKRTIPVFKKIAITDKKYPRNYSTIVKKYKK